ncbi:unnamed protein product [Peniophora sp. CBMAI 1063]|nr:unnamed protein product [Peniophora sp. CBMAI 1063]
MRGTEIAASLSLESSNATSRAEPVSRESIGSRDRLLPLLLGPGVNLTPRRRASHRNATPRTTSHGPERSTRSLHSGRPLRTPQDGTLQFSEDDMMDPFDSTDVEDDARESSFAPGLSQRTESLSTIIGSSSDSPLAEGIQRTQTMPTASGDRVCDHCEGRGYISSSAPIRRTTTEQSTGREAPRSSSSAVPRRSTRTPSAGPSTSSQDSGAPVSQSRPTPSRIVRSPQRNDARVYGPNADPRSPMRTDGTSVLQNGRPVHFTRYTPPQSLAAFSASLQTPPRSQ